MKLLFVCAGNTCRSPLAMALCSVKRPEDEARSRGMAAAEGAPAAAHAVTVASEHGATLEKHTAAPLAEADLLWAERVYVMNEAMGACLRERFPDAAEKVAALPCGEVEDPYGRDLEVYRRTAETLLKGLENL